MDLLILFSTLIDGADDVAEQKTFVVLFIHMFGYLVIIPHYADLGASSRGII